MTGRLIRGALVAASALWAPVAEASRPVTWDHPAAAPDARQAERDPRAGAPRGAPRAEGVAVGEEGRLTLSLPLREIFPGTTSAVPPPLLWSAALDASGTLYLGAGNIAEVLSIDKKGAATPLFGVDDLGVRALAAAPGGDVFVATFPNGDIYRIPRGKEPEPWVEMEERYLWAMTVDPTGRLYVGTGERGQILRVPTRGQKEIVFDTDQAHITSLAFDRQGRLLAGTDPDGLLYRLAEDGRVEILLDSELREISAVTVASDGAVYAAAVSEEVLQPARRPGEKSDLMIEVTPAPDGSILEDPDEIPRKIVIDLAELLPASSAGRDGTMGRVYRIEQGKSPVLVWKSDVERVYALAPLEGGGVLAGTGSSAAGRIYRIEPDGGWTMLHQVREPQVTSLVAAPGGRTYATTGNPGRVYLLEGGGGSSGTYSSEVYDAGRTARWGAISWDADVPPGSRLELSTRSGHRPVPDSTWSAWSPPYASDRGSAIASPAARYLQWKATLSRVSEEASPAVHRVRVTLLPQNLAPAVKGLAVLRGGEAADPPARPSEPGQGAGEAGAAPAPIDPPKGARWIVWEASDPDGDPISQSILIRKDGEREFRPLVEGTAASPFALDQARMEEGRYTVKVEVSDRGVNPAPAALTDTALSESFLVDRTPPRAQTRRPQEPAGPGPAILELDATDALSAILRAEYSLDPDKEGAPWLPLPCKDGICDTAAESFLLELSPGVAHGKVRVRIVDASGNETVVDAAAPPR
ncbi:MAG TPA: hypothetical protein VJV23_12790 [Candidatus Polarisedimenticolia bacterium]|nr:hypothetical protein [Candidatus Polarisedimenticolia bacterium]